MITIDPTTHVSKQARANPAKPDSLRAQSPRMTAARHLHCTHQQHGGQPSSCERNRPSHSPAGPAAATTAAPTHATVDERFFTSTDSRASGTHTTQSRPYKPLSARHTPTGSGGRPDNTFQQSSPGKHGQARPPQSPVVTRVTACRRHHRTHKQHGGQPSPGERSRPSRS